MKRVFEITKDEAKVVGEALADTHIDCYQLVKDEKSCIVNAEISSRQMPKVQRRIKSLQLAKKLKIPVLNREDVLSTKSGVVQSGEESFFEKAFL